MTPHINLPTISTPSVFTYFLRSASRAVATSMAPVAERCSIMQETTDSVNSGWPCKVSIWISELVGVGDSEFHGESSIRMGAWRKRTMPWFGVTADEARISTLGGALETWSRCICCNVYMSGDKGGGQSCVKHGSARWRVHSRKLKDIEGILTMMSRPPKSCIPTAVSCIAVGPISHLPSLGTHSPPRALAMIWCPKQKPGIQYVSNTTSRRRSIRTHQ